MTRIPRTALAPRPSDAAPKPRHRTDAIGPERDPRPAATVRPFADRGHVSRPTAAVPGRPRHGDVRARQQAVPDFRGAVVEEGPDAARPDRSDDPARPVRDGSAHAALLLPRNRGKW